MNLSEIEGLKIKQTIFVADKLSSELIKIFFS